MARKIDLKPFNERVEKGLISRRQKGNLLIYNYTNEVQWSKAWEKYTMMARGLIVKDDGLIIARPFRKMFNLEEQFGGDSFKNLPKSIPEITSKKDGSLGILYIDPVDNDIAIATRGSFDSDQAIWATKWIREHRPKEPLLENVTYCFEIVFKMNRIVVNYGDWEGLFLIGLVHNDTGKIYSYNDVKREAIRQDYEYPEQFHMTIPEILKYTKDATDGQKEEGFVLFYPEENLQLKCKLLSYVLLHRLTFGITVRSIWENMMYGQNVQEIFLDAPDEVMSWIKMWEKKINDSLSPHIEKVDKAYETIKDMPTRKEQALWLKDNAPEYLGSVFSRIDGKSWKLPLYKMVKPSKEDASQSFKIIKEDI